MSAADMTPEKAKEEMELARNEVVTCEKEIQSVKAKIRELGVSNDGPPNSLEIVALKVEGLPETAQPKFVLQLSSPVEEQTISKLFDQPGEEGTTATFTGVETSNATLTIVASDADIPLGSSDVQDVAPMCSIKDVMESASEYIHEFTVDILPGEGKPKAEEKPVAPATSGAEETATTEETTETPSEETSTEKTTDKPSEDTTEATATTATIPETPATSTTATEAVCTITFRAKYKPSPKDKREELYECLNKVSQKKSKALDRLRKSATVVSRVAQTSTLVAPPSQAKSVQKGFLNKAAKKPSRLQAWYNRNLGPRSFVRKWFPLVKNYIIFFGALGLMHFRGQELALPAPV